MRRCVLLLALTALTACSTLADNVVSSIDGESKRKTEALYHELIRLYLDLPLLSTRQGLEDELEQLRDQETYNRDFEARIMGLSALWSLLDGKEGRAKNYLAALDETGRPDELGPVTRALTQEDPVPSLEEAAESLFETEYLSLFLGEELYRKGEFGESLSRYEEVQDRLPPDIAAFAGERIDAGLNLYLSPVSDNTGRDIIEKKEMNLSEFLIFFHSQTDILFGLEGADAEATLNNWRREQLLLPGDESDSTLLRRKLSNILYRLDWHDKHGQEPFPGPVTLALPDEYAFMETSPIGDVPLEDPDFPAILLVIEREWINLVDGENFLPDRPVRGEELLPLLGKLSDYFDQ